MIMSEEESILSQLDTISEIFTTPATIGGLNRAIELYSSCWNFVKKKFPDRTDLDLLQIDKISWISFYLSSESWGPKREQLQNNARVLKKILKTSSIRKNKIETITDLKKLNEKLMIIHYACTSVSISPVIVTSISIKNYPNGQITTFGMDSLKNETEILSDFIKFLQENADKIFVTWNQKSNTYGFPHLEQRCKDHAIVTVLPISDDKIIDLDDLFEKQFGQGYVKHPKLQNLAELNHLTLTNFLEGKEEIIMYEKKEFRKIENSTNRKVAILSALLDLSFDDKLKVEKNRLPLNSVLESEYFDQFGDGSLHTFLLLQLDLANHTKWFKDKEPEKNSAKKELAKSFIDELKDYDFHRLFWAGDGGVFVSKAEGKKDYDIIVDAADIVYDLFEKWKNNYKDLDTSQLDIRVSAHVSEIFADRDPDFWTSKELNKFIKYERDISEEGFAITEQIKNKLTSKKLDRFEGYLRINAVKGGEEIRTFIDSNHSLTSNKQKSFEKKLTDGPIVQIVNTGVEPPDPTNKNHTKYHPNLRNDGTTSVSNIRIHYKIMDRVVDLSDIMREKDDIRKRVILYEGSILPSGSARINPIDLERTEKEVSIIFWLEYDFGINESTEIIFDIRLKDFQTTGVVPYVHSNIVKAEKDLRDIQSGIRGAKI